MNSILVSVKKILGIAPDYDYFDSDLIMHINTAFSILTQLGVGSEKGFRITGEGEEWTEFLEDNPRLEMVKTYVGLKVRLMFDPPMSSAVTESINRQISELEWRINVSVDPGKKNLDHKRHFGCAPP